MGFFTGSHCILKLGVHLHFFIFWHPHVQQHIEHLFIFFFLGGGVQDKFCIEKKNPLQRVNGNAVIYMQLCNEVSTSWDLGPLTSTHLFVSFVMHTCSDITPRSIIRYTL